MSDINDVNTKVDEAIAAHEAGDVETALRKLRSARMLLVAIPDSSTPDGGSLRFDRASIESMITDLQGEKNAASIASAGGIRRSKVRYKRTDADEEDC